MQRLQHLSAPDAANLLNLGAPERLAVRDDRERLERRGRQALRASSKLRTLDCFGVLRTREDLESAGNFNKLYAMTIIVIMIAQLCEGFTDIALGSVGIDPHSFQIGQGDRMGARKERRLKQPG